MSIGINMNCYSGISTEKQIDLMIKNGFSATFCMADEQSADEMITAAQNAGIIVESLHAPLANINRMWLSDDSGDEMLKKQFSAIDKCKNFNIPTIVVHLSAGRPAPQINDRGIARYDALMEYARKSNVKIAFENSRCLANLAFALEKYEDAAFCWDVGHQTCFTPGMDFMPYFGNKIGALHLHDNMGELDRDLHLLPYDGMLDMEKAARAIAESGYSKAIMIEGATIHNDRYINFSPEEYYARAAAAARKFEKAVASFLPHNS